MSRLTFEVLNKDESSSARRGRLQLAHGVVDTPAFMPVGTQGTVKAMTPEELKGMQTQIILANTYHLYLRPGHELIARCGGLHRFMHWDLPILTDSGGYQVYSLSTLRKIDDDGVTFQSHLDGSTHRFTPEHAIDIQVALGVDIAMALDECPSEPENFAAVSAAVNRTTQWAERSLEARGDHAPALFGIVQGGVFPELREKSARAITALPFDGFALGGFSVGEGRDKLWPTLVSSAPLLPEGQPRYLMGMGTPEDILNGVAAGIDMFDCVLPTRTARNGLLYTSLGKLSIKQAKYQNDKGPIDSDCNCYACRNYCRAYLRHLYMSGEILAARLSTWHNLHFYQDLMARIRQSIARNRFKEFRKYFLEKIAVENDPILETSDTGDHA